MSITSIIVSVLAVIVLVTGLWLVWWYVSNPQAQTIQTPTTNNVQQKKPAQNNTNTNTIKPIAPGDVSDSAIDGSLAGIDAQMKNLDNDTINLDKSLPQ